MVFSCSCRRVLKSFVKASIALNCLSLVSLKNFSYSSTFTAAFSLSSISFSVPAFNAPVAGSLASTISFLAVATNVALRSSGSPAKTFCRFSSMKLSAGRSSAVPRWLSSRVNSANLFLSTSETAAAPGSKEVRCFSSSASLSTSSL